MPVSTYAERPTRFNLDVAVSFTADGETVHGRTLNVSETGMLANFLGYVELWVTGVLSLFVDDYQLAIRAKVARALGKDTGLSFVVLTDNDRRAVQILVDYASATMKPGEKVRQD